MAEMMTHLMLNSIGKFYGRIPEQHKLLVLSLVVGVMSGFAAVLLDWAVRSISRLLEYGIHSEYHFRYLVLPGIGMLISFLLVKYAVRDNIGHGVTKVLVAMSRNESRISPHNMWSSMLTSSVTIGFGGSVGAEAPIVYTGAAIGSNLGRISGLSFKNTTVLLGCGAAGAVAGIFKAPLAGVLFTMEILLFNVSMSSMLPMLFSTVSATVISYIFRGQTPVFDCVLTPFSMTNIPFYIVLGILAGFGSLYFTNCTLWLEDRLGRMQAPYLRWAVCATGLGLLIFLLPPLYGEGYDNLANFLTGSEPVIRSGSLLDSLLSNVWGIPLFFTLVFFAKVLAMTLTNAGGGVGGTFGPTLFAGAIMGFVVARCLNLLLVSSGLSVPEQNFVLVGMAALMAGVMQAPMTAIFLIAEISGGYELLIPLILTSAVSFGTVRIFEKYSIYTKRIAQSGELLTHDNDRSVLTLMRTGDLIRDKYPRVRPDASLRELVGVIADSSTSVIAVVDAMGHYEGYIDVDSNRKQFFRTDLYDKLHVYNLMADAPAVLHDSDRMDAVMSEFDRTGAWRLPVVDAERHYLGFISRSRMLTAYRQELREISHD